MQNRIFQINQRALYDEIGGREKSQQDPPNLGEAHEFWKLWDQPVNYNTEAEWLKKVEEEQNIAVLKVDVVNQFRKMPDWKSPGLDGIHVFMELVMNVD